MKLAMMSVRPTIAVLNALPGWVFKADRFGMNWAYEGFNERGERAFVYEASTAFDESSCWLVEHAGGARPYSLWVLSQQKRHSEKDEEGT